MRELLVGLVVKRKGVIPEADKLSAIGPPDRGELRTIAISYGFSAGRKIAPPVK